MTRLLALLRDRSGVAAMETALIGGLLLVPMLAGAADFGLILAGWAAASRAEQAGILYAFGTGASTSGMQSAATAAYGTALPAPTVTASTACYCLPSSSSWDRGSASAVSCTSTCSSGDVLTQFVTVSVSAAFTLPMPLPGISSPYTIASTATARLQ